ncbi:unnamed protein product, partial [Effrenium voratum]
EFRFVQKPPGPQSVLTLDETIRSVKEFKAHMEECHRMCGHPQHEAKEVEGKDITPRAAAVNGAFTSKEEKELYKPVRLPWRAVSCLTRTVQILWLGVGVTAAMRESGMSRVDFQVSYIVEERRLRAEDDLAFEDLAMQWPYGSFFRIEALHCANSTNGTSPLVSTRFASYALNTGALLEVPKGDVEFCGHGLGCLSASEPGANIAPAQWRRISPAKKGAICLVVVVEGDNGHLTLVHAELPGLGGIGSLQVTHTVDLRSIVKPLGLAAFHVSGGDLWLTRSGVPTPLLEVWDIRLLQPRLRRSWRAAFTDLSPSFRPTAMCRCEPGSGYLMLAGHYADGPGLALLTSALAAPKKTLQDDPVFQKKNYQENIETDAECNRSPLWGPFRVQLLQTAEEMRVELAYEKMMEWGLENVTKVDEQSKICLLGLVSMQYYFAHMLLFEVGSVEAAVDAFRMMDEHSGALHPDLLDKAAGAGEIWPISADSLDSMRRALLRASSGGGTGGPDRRRRFKNAFGLHDEDWRQVWGAWRPTGGSVAPVGPAGFGAARPTAPTPGFRVFVYDPDTIPALRKLARGGSFCKPNQWGMEVALHDWFLACPCRTDNPEEADFFFVPHYTSCLINHADTFAGCDTKQLCMPTTELFEEVLRESPYYRRVDGGRNHLFVWGSGMGADGPFASWRQWVPNAIFLMTEPELWNPYKEVVLPSYTPHKDIIVPGRLTVDDMISLGKMAKPFTERTVLGHFIGWPRPPHFSVMDPQLCQNSSCPLNVRSVLLDLKDTEESMHVDVDVPYLESFLGLTSSLFCFVPRGKSAWSSRFFQTFFAGCIPVLLNDRYEVPFGELVDVPKAVIKWPMTEVPALVEYLKHMAMEDAERMLELHEAGKELRCWYAWPPSWVEWSWLELNKSKFNRTCEDWHIRNAYVAVTRLLATKAGTGRGRFYWPGAPPGDLQRPPAI